jgi:hypothetical protein|tara:strand:- start:390 stop:908 length:519 start_codon:yes stop_codon:yes gene_type:complete
MHTYIFPIHTYVNVCNVSHEESLSYLQNEIDKRVGPMDYATNVKGQMTEWDSFVNDKKFQKYVGMFLEKLKEENPWKIQCWKGIEMVGAWGNKLKANDYVDRHDHRGDTDFSSVIYFSNTYIILENFHIDVKRGDIVTFDPTVKHWTNPETEDRYSLAMNWKLITDKVWKKS